MIKKRVWIVLAVSLAVALPFEIYIMMNFLDPKTGFYSDGGVKAAAVTVLIAAAAVILAVLSRTGTDEFSYKPYSNATVAAFCALTGVFVLIQSVSAFASSEAFSAGFVVYRIFSVLGLPAGAMFLVSAYDFGSGTQKLRQHPLLALFPSIWGCMCLIMLFITYAAVVNVFASFYNTCTAVLLLLFLFTQAKFITGIESQKSGRRIFTVGIPAAFIAIATGIPNCIVYFSGKGTSDIFPIGFQMINILIGIYIISFLASQKRAQTLEAAGDSEEVHAEVKHSEPAEEKGANTEPKDKKGNLANEDKEDKNQEMETSACNLMGQYIEFLKVTYPSEEKFSNRQISPFYSRNEI